MEYIPQTLFIVVFSIFNLVHCHEEFIYNSDASITYYYHSVPMNWLQARTTCSNGNRRLIMPKNGEEVSFIEDILKLKNHTEYVFLDSHDFYETNQFVSQDSYIQYFYHKWETGFPLNTDNNCLAYDNKKGTIKNHPCKSPLPFICQDDGSLQKKPENVLNFNVLPDDPRYIYEPSTGKYIKLHMHLASWHDARAICNAEGGRLAVIETAEQDEFMTKMSNDLEYIWGRRREWFYVGTHDHFKPKLFYTLADHKLDDGYSRWKKGDPISLLFRCVALHNSPTAGGLCNLPCENNLQFFCERKYT